MTKTSLVAARDLAIRVLLASGVSEPNAEPVARGLVAADADGLGSHGLLRLPAYADQALVGKVNGQATALVERTGSGTLRVDAKDGFAFPAIDLAVEEGAALAKQAGIAGVAIHNSHHAGVLGHHVEAAAQHGLVALAFTNSRSAIAPWGGKVPLFGTNPIAFAAPRRDQPPLVVDLSVSKAARGRVMVAHARGEPIPGDWALDAQGHPTTDAAAALAGTLLPFGDAKGAALALVVEILAAALTGSAFGFETSSMFDAEGAPPRLGQLFVFVAPRRLAGEGFGDRLELLISTVLAQPGTRLPGQRRLESRARAAVEGIHIPPDLLGNLQRRAQS